MSNVTQKLTHAACLWLLETHWIASSLTVEQKLLCLKQNVRMCKRPQIHLASPQTLQWLIKVRIRKELLSGFIASSNMGSAFEKIFENLPSFLFFFSFTFCTLNTDQRHLLALLVKSMLAKEIHTPQGLSICNVGTFVPHLELIPPGKREAPHNRLPNIHEQVYQDQFVSVFVPGRRETGVRPVKQEGSSMSLDGSMTHRSGELLDEVPGNPAPRGWQLYKSGPDKAVKSDNLWVPANTASVLHR